MVFLRIRELPELVTSHGGGCETSRSSPLRKLQTGSRKTKTPGPGVPNVGGGQPAGEGMRVLCKPTESGEQNYSGAERFLRRVLKEPPNEVMRLESAGESTSRSK